LQNEDSAQQRNIAIARRRSAALCDQRAAAWVAPHALILFYCASNKSKGRARRMRIIHLIAASAAALMLAACGNNAAKTDAQTAQAAQTSFPSLVNASYRAEAVSTAEDGKTTQIVQVRSGAKTRMEFTSDQGAMVMIFDGESQTAHALMPAQRMAIRLAAGQNNFAVRAPDQVWSAESEGETLTSTGPCTVAGETGVEWTVQKEGATAPTISCVTADGIILKMTRNGRVEWETTSVTRGPQDPQQFVVPAGYTLQDFTGLSQAAQSAPGMPPGMDRESAMQMAREMAEKAKNAQ